MQSIKMLDAVVVIRKFKMIILLVSSSVIFTSCQSTRTMGLAGQETKEMKSVIGSLAEAVGGKELNEQEINNLEQNIRKDPEAREAVQMISDSISGKNKQIKYCPITGKRYSPKLKECPVHHEELKWVAE